MTFAAVQAMMCVFGAGISVTHSFFSLETPESGCYISVLCVLVCCSLINSLVLSVCGVWGVGACHLCVWVVQVKRRNDPTSAKVSTILGSYDKVKELVTSSHMIGAILQPATPRPSQHTFEAPARPPPTSHSKHQPTNSARNGMRPELSRQGVFEQFQQSSSASRQSTEQLDRSSEAGLSEKSSARRRSEHVSNGRRHRPSSSSSSSSSDSKHKRPRLVIPGPKVRTYDTSIFDHNCSVICIISLLYIVCTKYYI